MNTQQVARAGEHFVAAELHRRGAYAVTFAGNMPEIDILASDSAQSRTVAIQVKTRASGTWQTDTRKADRPTGPNRFWVFVDLADPEAPPEYYVVPEKWIKRDILKHDNAYRERYRKERGKERPSTHHAIAPARIMRWKGRWDVLGLFAGGVQEARARRFTWEEGDVTVIRPSRSRSSGGQSRAGS